MDIILKIIVYPLFYSNRTICGINRVYPHVTLYPLSNPRNTIFRDSFVFRGINRKRPTCDQ